LAAVSGGGSIRGLAAVGLLANAVGLAACLWQVRRQDPGLRIRCNLASPRGAALLLSFGAYSILGSAGSYLAYGTDALVIGAILNASDVAFFGLAANVLLVLSGIVAGFTGTLMPVASEASARGDTSQAARHYLIATRVALVIAMPGLLVAIAAGPALMTAWLGAAVGEPSGQLLRILAFAHVALLANSAALPIALGVGLHRQASLLFAVEGVLNLGLSIALAGTLGVSGVALGTAIPSVLVQGLVWPVFICRSLGIRYSRYVREALAPHLGCAAAAAGSAAAAHMIGPPTSTFDHVVAAAVIPPVYWAVAAFTCVSADIRARWARRAGVAICPDKTSR
jgi:O-antigen/teichoic acid export membrane protein